MSFLIVHSASNSIVTASTKLCYWVWNTIELLCMCLLFCYFKFRITSHCCINDMEKHAELNSFLTFIILHLGLLIANAIILHVKYWVLDKNEHKIIISHEQITKWNSLSFRAIAPLSSYMLKKKNSRIMEDFSLIFKTVRIMAIFYCFCTFSIESKLGGFQRECSLHRREKEID